MGILSFSGRLVRASFTGRLMNADGTATAFPVKKKGQKGSDFSRGVATLFGTLSPDKQREWGAVIDIYNQTIPAGALIPPIDLGAVTATTPAAGTGTGDGGTQPGTTPDTTLGGAGTKTLLDNITKKREP